MNGIQIVSLERKLSFVIKILSDNFNRKIISLVAYVLKIGYFLNV